ncbi:alpha-galactosidase [Aureococcus anophagefferens]|uniref:Alpha-galactosidase n=1 Tax=Aureococcus anophagefferens TaxID=44056 RepID=A0ABR1FLZ1_AURAN
MWAASLLLIAPAALASDNGLALTPPLGWNSWNQFQCNVSDALIRRQADAMVSLGLVDLGYQYVVIDDCWQADARDVSGRLAPDATRFPAGIAALSAYVRSRGLKLGIYSDVGTKTCAGYPGSFGHYDLDARTFADWGIDYLKFDTCSLTWKETLDPRPFYARRGANMSAALNATGRPVLYSMCNWGRHDPWLWAPEIANMWRTTMDVWPQWHRVASILDSMAGLSAYGGRGGFNDADMVEVGVDSRIFNWAGMPETNLTEREAAAHFTMWAIMGAPLVLGLDLEAAEQWALDVVSHAGVLAVNQDPLAYPGRRVTSDSDAVLGVCLKSRCASTQVWAKDLSGGRVAVAFLNAGDAYSQYSSHYGDEAIAVDFDELHIAGRFRARDVWADADLGAFESSMTSPAVPPHGAHLVVLAPDP